MERNSPRLEVRRVVKRFPGVTALDGVSLTLFPGEVVALLGENGAGKSTLMRILGGIERPDSGELCKDGRPLALPSARAAAEAGIFVIHQELNLAGNLDVGENLFLGREPSRLGWVNRRRIDRDARAIMSRLGLDLHPRTLVDTLSPAQQQMVEIGKALSANASVLLMDEPTSSLSAPDARTLFRVIRELRDSGVSIVYISHRLGEVAEISDRIVALRDGRNAGELDRQGINHDAMVRLMVGRELQPSPTPGTRSGGVAPALDVDGLTTPLRPGNRIRFSIGSGEIVGIAGLVGSGRTSLLRTLFGVARAGAGQVRIGGMPIPPGSPSAAVRAGVVLVPEDRKTQGLVLDMSVTENLNLAMRTFRRPFRLFIDRRDEDAAAVDLVGRLRVKTPHIRQIARCLSGGNQQKLVLGKWLALEPRVLLLDEPTRGIDVGAKQEIYDLLETLADSGMSVLFASSDMEEVLRLSHRVLVMHEGRIAGELRPPDIDEEAVMRLATGGEPAGRTAVLE